MARRRTELEPDLIALCRRRGDDVCVLLVQEQGSRTPSRVVEEFTCPPEGLESRILDARCGRVLAILPSTATLVRTVHVPSGGTLQVESAIRIEAESRLLGSASAHRSGLGLIGIEGPTPTGLIVSWPDGLDPGLPELAPEIDVTWIPEIACLAILAGDTPTSLAAVIDGDGSTAAVVPTPKGPVYRATRGIPSTSPEDRLRPLVAESLLGEDIDPSTVEQSVRSLLSGIDGRLIDGALLIPTDDESGVDQLVDQDITRFSGIDAASARLLLGALAASRGDNADLAGLRRHEHFEKPSFLGAMTHRLSDGRTAVAIATFALIMMILSPLAFSGIRLMIMRSKVDDLASLEERVRRVENLEKVYRELDRQAWSITKLLGDVSNLMPEQIELLSMTLTHGEPITVMGVAKRDADMSGTDIVFDFNRRLRESKLFLDYGPVPSIEQPDARGYTEFKLTAVLDDPLRPVQPRPENDYAVLSYRDRRYGPVDDDGYLIVDPDARQERLDAMIARGIDLSKPLPAMEAAPSSSSEAPSSSRADAGSSTPPSERTSSSSSRASSEETETDIADARTSREPSRESTRSRDRASSSGRDRESSREGGSSDGPASRSSIRSRVIEIPEPLSSEEIETLSNAEAKARLAKIAGARNAPNATEEQKKALKDEWDSLLNRIRETNP
ncbi:MAG: hypothetical protein CMJ34_03510 [Phycisphaerae bacterium]|nr:hypothetical protein [Phycisphaerae bacterium]